MKRDATPAPEGEQPTAKRARITGKVAKAGTDTPVKTGRAACPKHEATSPPAHTAKAAAAAKAAAVAKARAVAKEPPAATPKKTEAAEPAAAAEAEPPVTTAAAEAEAKAEREAKQAAEKQAREARQVAEKATREAAAKKAKEDAAAVPEPPSQLSTPSGQPMKMEELGKSVVAQAASKDATDVAATDVAEDKVQKRKDEARLWAKFQRTFEKMDTARADPESKCPREIVQEMLSGIGLSKKEWFHKWVAAGNSWMKATITETIADAEETESGVVKAWMTLDQMIDHYKNETVGRAVVKALKEKEPHNVKLHRLTPELDEATKYYVEVREEDAERIKRVANKVVAFSGEIDGESAGMIASRMRQPLRLLGGQPPGQEPTPGHPDTRTATGTGADTQTANPPDTRTPAQIARAKQQAEAKAEREAKQAAEKQAREARQVAEKATREAAAKKAKEDAEARKKSPAGRADKWISECGSAIDYVQGQKALAQASNLDAGSKSMMEKRFDDIMKEYADLRNNLSAALSGHEGVEIEESLSNASSLADSVQKAKKTLAALIKAA